MWVVYFSISVIIIILVYNISKKRSVMDILLGEIHVGTIY